MPVDKELARHRHAGRKAGWQAGLDFHHGPAGLLKEIQTGVPHISKGGGGGSSEIFQIGIENMAQIAFHTHSGVYEISLHIMTRCWISQGRHL